MLTVPLAIVKNVCEIYLRDLKAKLGLDDETKLTLVIRSPQFPDDDGVLVGADKDLRAVVATITRLAEISGEPSSSARRPRRWRLMSDGSGHGYVCPAELVDEANRMFRAVEEYWEAEDQTGPVPPDPDFAHRVEGAWTFADPEENREHFDRSVSSG